MNADATPERPDEWLTSPTLSGQFVTLEPLSAQHAPLLARQYSPDVFQYLGRGAPQDDSVPAMLTYLAHLNAEANRVNWAIRLPGGDVAGRISYLDVRREHRALEIGTMIMTAHQGTPVNPEAKFLLLRRAFEDLHAVRVQFKVDARNERSQRAMEKLGALREGVLRKYQTRPDGFVRDSVMYSIIDDEWPHVKVRLQERLALLASRSREST